MQHMAQIIEDSLYYHLLDQDYSQEPLPHQNS